MAREGEYNTSISEKVVKQFGGKLYELGDRKLISNVNLKSRPQKNHFTKLNKNENYIFSCPKFASVYANDLQQ